MHVVALYLKPRPGADMQPVNRVDAIAGLGLEGDCHRDAASPRQLLVVSQWVLDDLRIDARAVRANVVVDGPIDTLASGTVIQLGGTALRLTIPCESCTKLEGARRGLARELEGRRGMLARVMTGGRLHVGDRVEVATERCRALEESWKDRLVVIVKSLPPGMLLSYRRLALLAGVQTSYCRAFPRVLERARDELGPARAARVIPTSAEKLHDASLFWDGASYYQW